ncbi:MAG: DUF3267 domain-containing protein [Clostridiales bacterium]|nr:DUF3267 domain-containing protein [Clostridiales bacterium]
MKTYEKELPEGYVEAKVIDAKNSKLGIVLNLIAMAVLVVTVVVTWFALFAQYNETFFDIIKNRILLSNPWANIGRLGLLVAVLFVYIILHELVHGVVYKLLTKQKLTFGVTLTVAYCGVPNVYVYRTAALLALLAPFVVFLPVFLVPMFFLKNYIDVLLCAVMLGMHVGGCCGDLYNTFLYLFKFRDPSTLMRDTGPKQTFYVKKQSEDFSTSNIENN